MTIYCYDTEFLEDGHTIDLISIGIVCEDGREYYAINSDADWDRIRKDDWLMENVVAHLPTHSTGQLKRTGFGGRPPTQLGPAIESSAGDMERAVAAFVSSRPIPTFAAAVEEKFKVSAANARQILSRAHRKGLIDKTTRGLYTAVTLSQQQENCISDVRGWSWGGINMRDSSVKPKWVIANEVRDFLLWQPHPELWAYYAAYDHVALAQLWGRMIGLPEGIPMWTNDLQQELFRRGVEPPSPPDDEHNALADARWVLKTLNGLRVERGQ